MRLYEIENSTITVYHGDNHNTSFLNPAIMNNGNNQEGIGIYFGTLDVAEAYGNDIVSATIDPTKFVSARDIASDWLPLNKIALLLKKLNEGHQEFWYFFSDYAEISEPQDIVDHHYTQVAELIGEGELRNFQIELAQASNVELFVGLWNKIFYFIHGLHYDEFYCIINTDYKLTKIR